MQCHVMERLLGLHIHLHSLETLTMVVTLVFFFHLHSGHNLTLINVGMVLDSSGWVITEYRAKEPGIWCCCQHGTSSHR